MFKNNKFKKIIVAVSFLALIALASTNGVNAQIASSTTADQLQALINQLTAQLQALQQQYAQILAQQQQIAQTVSSITTTLKQGDSGENVKTLQALLATDSTIYPEGLISGFYGSLTTKAVKRFQEKHGLESVGFIGPKTRIKLNELLGEHPLAFENYSASSTYDNYNATSTNSSSTGISYPYIYGTSTLRIKERENEGENESKRICAIVPPGHLIAPGWLREEEGDNNQGEGENDHENNYNRGEHRGNVAIQVIPTCQVLPLGIVNNPNPTSTVDNIAPNISNVSALDISTSSVRINWTTSEAANSKIYFGTALPINMDTASSVSDGNLVLTHNVIISGLNPNTVYYYLVKSVDASNNAALSSSAQQFTTLALPVADTTAPIISGVSAANIASSTASVIWATNEPATSKVYYSITTPINLTTASSVSDTNLATSHALNLSGLTASSTYQFVVESKDAANNTATSTAQTFITSAQ